MRLHVLLDDGREAIITFPRKIGYRQSGAKWAIRAAIQTCSAAPILTWLPVFTQWFVQDLPPATMQSVIEFTPDFAVAI